MKHNELINATVFLVTGERGSGKSTWAKTVVARLMTMQAGLLPNGHPDKMRAWIHDNKREGAAGEYGRLAEFLDAQVVQLNRSRSVNIFDVSMGMSEWDLLELAVNMCELVTGERLRGFQPLALQVGMSKMLRESRDLSSLEVLEAKVRSLAMSDVEAYFRASDGEVLATFDTVFSARPELREQLQVSLSQPHRVPEAEFMRDTALVAAYLKRVLSGDFGGIFGGIGSLRPVLTQPVLVFDWSGVNSNARTLLESYLWKLQTVALDNNDLELIPHIHLGDEEHEAIKNLMHARFRSAQLRKARAFHTVDISLTQFWTDILEVGDAGSELRGLAEGISRSVGAHILFRQPNDEKTRHNLLLLGISPQDIDFLTSDSLPVGCAGIKVPGRRLTMYSHMVAPSELPIIPTNSATDRMLDRVVAAEFTTQAVDVTTNGHVRRYVP